mgnify:CR=1 FL=1
MARTLFALRHLETLSNRELRFGSGDTDDVLIPGQSLPEATTQVLCALASQSLQWMHTGRKRTADTLLLTAQTIGRSAENVVIQPDFLERMGGTLAGLTFSEMQSRFPAIKLAAPSDLWRCEAPELGLESLVAFVERVKRGLADLAAHPTEQIVLVCHAGTMKAMQASFLPREQWLDVMCKPSPQNGELLEWRLDGNIP